MKRLFIIIILIFIISNCVSEKEPLISEEPLNCLICHVQPIGLYQEVSCMECHTPINDFVSHYNNKITVEPSILSCMQCHEVVTSDGTSI